MMGSTKTYESRQLDKTKVRQSGCACVVRVDHGVEGAKDRPVPNAWVGVGVLSTKNIISEGRPTLEKEKQRENTIRALLNTSTETVRLTTREDFFWR